jgi:pimeloyl-ACP methyl ester carboxylesterase
MSASESRRRRPCTAAAILLLGAATMTSAPRRESGEAAVNGTRLYYEVAGAGLPVVLVSGGGTLDRRQWDDQFNALSRQFRVLRYDIRGIGRSARPTTEFAHHDDLRALLEFLRITRAVICGTSFGGAIALDFALDHPHLVTGLVLVSAGLSSDKQEGIEAVRALSAVATKQGLDGAIKLVTEMPSFISPKNESAKRRIRQMYLDNRDLFEAGFPLVSLWQPTTPPAGERLREINVPTLVIVGANDGPTAFAAADKIASSVAGARKVVIGGGGHMVIMDEPAEFNRVVGAFLGHIN